MDETLSLILRGCELARAIEAKIPSTTAVNPHFLLSSCREVVARFNEAVDLLNSQNYLSSHNPSLVFASAPTGGGGDNTLQVMNLLRARTVADDCSPFFLSGLRKTQVGGLWNPGFNFPAVAPPTGETVIDFGGGARGGNSDDLAKGTCFVGGWGEFPAAAGSHMESSDRSAKKRKRIHGTHIEMVPAGDLGNPEILPDNGYTWRKYGQKDILGLRFPRSYYRCSHKNYGCTAKKQVQRLEEDPYTYEVTYCGDHTCQTFATSFAFPTTPPTSPSLLPSSSSSMSCTPPASSPLPPPDVGAIVLQAPDYSSTLSNSIQMVSNWLLRDGEAWNNEGDDISPYEVDERCNEAIHIRKEVECFVADLTDVMFNSSSCRSSMGTFFSSFEEDN